MAASFTRFSRITHACLARVHTHTARQYTALATPTHKVAQNAQPTTAWFAFAAGTAAAAAMAATVMSTTSCAATVPSSPPPMPVVAAPAPSATDGAPKFRPAACPVEAPAGQTYTEVDIGAHARQHRNDGHMIYDTMWGDKKLEQYRVWLTEDKQSMVALVLPGSSLVGHPRITHGGCTAAVADNLFGTLFFVAARGAMGFTANLTINYRAPWMANTPAVFVSRVVKVEGRKYFLEGAFKHLDGKTVIANTSALFVVPRAAHGAGSAGSSDAAASVDAPAATATPAASADGAPATSAGSAPRSERK